MLIIVSGGMLIRFGVQAAERAFGGAILDLDEDDLQLNNESFYFQGVKDAGGLGLTREMIEAAVPTVEINGTRYQCTYGRCEPSSILIYLYPEDSLIAQNTFEALLVTVVILLLLVQTAVFLASVIRYVSSAAPAEPQKLRKYTPEALKRKMLGGGILGLISVFVIAAMIQSLGMLYAETIESRTAVDSLVRQLQTNEFKRREAMVGEEEEWIIYYGDQLAFLLSEHPALGTKEKLRDFSDTMAIDYVMLFDANGNETACSHDYYVELEGFWGRVEEIGIRTTKLVNKDNDVKIIENSQIKNLISKTKYYSRCVVRMTVSAQESLLRIEGILSEYLPRIGQKYADILYGPEYIGVSEVSSKNIVPFMTSMELMIIAECKEENKDAVIRNLNRELIILFEGKNIRMI